MFQGRYELERVIDDFVFLCFLCGNDFLPHLPHQSIQRGSIDSLLEVYVHLRPDTLPGYLTKGGQIDLTHLKLFLTAFSKVEEEVIRRELIRKVCLCLIEVQCLAMHIIRHPSHASTPPGLFACHSMHACKNTSACK